MDYNVDVGEAAGRGGESGRLRWKVEGEGV